MPKESGHYLQVYRKVEKCVDSSSIYPISVPLSVAVISSLSAPLDSSSHRKLHKVDRDQPSVHILHPSSIYTMSLRQNVLRSHTAETLDKHFSTNSSRRTQPNPDKDDSDDELINVVSPRRAVYRS